MAGTKLKSWKFFILFGFIFVLTCVFSWIFLKYIPEYENVFIYRVDGLLTNGDVGAAEALPRGSYRLDQRWTSKRCHVLRQQQQQPVEMFHVLSSRKVMAFRLVTRKRDWNIFRRHDRRKMHDRNRDGIPYALSARRRRSSKHKARLDLHVDLFEQEEWLLTSSKTQWDDDWRLFFKLHHIAHTNHPR